MGSGSRSGLVAVNGRVRFQKVHCDARRAATEVRGNRFVAPDGSPTLLSIRRSRHSTALLFSFIDHENVVRGSSASFIRGSFRLMAAVHRSARWSKGPSVRMSIARRLCVLERAARLHLCHLASPLCTVIHDLRAVVESDGRYGVPTMISSVHGDIAGNIVNSEKGLSLVDFEHAGMGIPLLEFSSMVVRHDLHSARDDAVRSYLGYFPRRHEALVPLCLHDERLYHLYNVLHDAVWLGVNRPSDRRVAHRVEYLYFNRRSIDDLTFSWKVV